MRDYTKIKAWLLADDLTVAVYLATRCFPREELCALTSQIRRAVYSVPANIAEGASRGSKKDYLHFLYIARGSLNETHYFIHLAHRLEYLNQTDHDRLTAQANEAAATLNGLIRAVEKEAHLVTRTVAKLTSFLAISLSLVSSLGSPVSGP